MAAAPTTLRSIEIGGDRYRRGLGGGGGSRVIVTAHRDGREGRVSRLLERRRCPLALLWHLGLGLGRVRVERGLGVFSVVAASLAPATPGAFGAPSAAALVAHHRDSF